MSSQGIIYSIGTGMALWVMASCSTTQPVVESKSPVARDPALPTIEREFRAAWVATVANINWPSEPGLTVEQQKAEALELLDLLHQLNFNAVILQVRPQCDALYNSSLEPWSYYLTGTQGTAPEPYYDPLEFWISEAHTRGLELHAWLNPYRAHHRTGGEITEASIVKKKPDLVVPLETGFWWLDPSKIGTQDHSYEVVMDIIDRYDVDGIHFDDYFYPYPSYNNNQDFPDDDSWHKYLSRGGSLSRDDWRRKSVNDFIQRLYTGIKRKKPYVKFGLSPFGIWRPNNPPSIQGFDQHDQLYADARLWLNQGWIDYWTPQLYWPINQLPQSFPVLLGWWIRENKMGRHIWPGMSIGRLQDEEGADETINQIMITRGMLPEVGGNVHWSINPLITNRKLSRALAQGPYRRPALIPSSPWIDDMAPRPPEVQFDQQEGRIRVSWSHANRDEVARWVVYWKYGAQWQHQVLGPAARSTRLAAFDINRSLMSSAETSQITDAKQVLIPLAEIAVSAVDRAGNESTPHLINVSGLSYDSAPDLPDIRRSLAGEPLDWDVPWMGGH